MNAAGLSHNEVPNFEWSAGELDVWRRREPLSVSQFAQRHIRVTLGAHIGAWDNAITPYLVTPMDSADLPWVKEIVVCGPEQSGKTMICINIHAKNIVYRPGNIKYIMLPKETLAKKIARDRLITMYRQCAPIAEKLSLQPDDTASGRIAFRDGTVVYPIWGSSPSEMSSFPADFTFADEIDKNQDLTGDESDALRLLEKRTRQFRRSLNLKCSTPTLESGHIWKALNACAEINDYYVTCPVCGELQVMKEENLTWPGQGELFAAAEKSGQPVADPNIIKMAGSARYRCEGVKCNTLWSDLDRDRAVRTGAWVARTVVPRPPSVGFHITGFICPDISLSELACAIINARGGDPAAEKERDNSYFGIPHRAQKADRKEDSILKLRDDRPEGLVPSEQIAAITCVADMQKRGFWYKTTAWSYGLDQESWTLKTGFVDSWEALRKVMFESQFPDVSGKIYNVSMCAMDSGGGEGEDHADLSRTAEAYLFAAANPGVILFKGRRRMTRHYNVTDIDRIPGTNKPLPGSAKLYTINTTFFKDKLAAKLLVNPSDPGSWHLHKDIEEDFARQMCAESKNDQGIWDCPKGRDNHYWDCSQMEMALVEIAQVKLWPKPDPAAQQIPQGRRTRSSGVQS